MDNYSAQSGNTGHSRLVMRGIVKRFQNVLANDRINLEVRTGEIHGLLGENGAGKTTLMNVLYGIYQPDAGEIYLNGEQVVIRSPREALARRIGMIHQRFLLIPNLSVAENIIIGMKESSPWLNLKKVSSRIKELADLFGLGINPAAQVGELSVGEQQRVEIIKALYREVDLLIMDEPTAILSPQEVEKLFVTLQTFVEKGLTIIFITHKLNEVMNITDRVTILRCGRLVNTVETARTSKPELSQMVIGRELVFRDISKRPCSEKEVLRIENLKTYANTGLLALKGVNFSIRQGEILGLAGVSGNGQTELAQVLAGIRPPCEGKIYLDGHEVTSASPRKLFELGEGFIPADRTFALAAKLSLQDNLVLKLYHRPPFCRYLFLSHQAIHSYADRLISEFNIKTPTAAVAAQTLSGGNLQRLLLARELSQNPSFLITHQPTQGLDVGAAEYVWSQLIEARERGTAILLISEDLDEILDFSDRVLVIYEGNFFKPSQISRKIIGLLMTGEQE